MPLFESFGISASGLTAQRLWLDIISNNIANMHTAGRPGDPAAPVYRREAPVFVEKLRQAADALPGRGLSAAGVDVAAVVADPAPPRMVYDPRNPLANPQTGYVAYPDINITNEMVNMIAASRAYEAGVTTLNAAKDMALKGLAIGQG
ncbi:flagellar basal body rod protein FlgC [Desulfotomaculum copahuensis]|uniref:Flagellar basal-body rod protein FlgC n=1 Tax=Desulfotomaculum copahuensis TaxID=1838280 RepID=A0A1B7LBL7_9FIRM|nr:flagellar basal body rod protein FlgC [Desulfotomaculum copahuensis]OAT79935.1 flagellar basal body rod protein FlgC [Desulfotomaculum copahuensis]